MSLTTAATDWRTLGACRQCPHGHAIIYRATLETTGPAAVAAALAAGERAGALSPDPHPAGSPCFAVLDILAWNEVAEMEENVADRCIPTAEAFDWWASAVELRATSSDCPRCEPAAYAATYPEN